MAEENIVIEKNKPLSKSGLWGALNKYYAKEGIGAWAHKVPYFATSNPYVANAYAQVIDQYIQELIEQKKYTGRFYILELGAGHGKLGYYVTKKLLELRQNAQTPYDFCYILSDVSPKTVKFWESYPPYAKLVADGVMDFSFFNVLKDDTLTLLESGQVLDKKNLGTPLITIANYLLNSIPCDLFSSDGGKVYEKKTRVSCPKDNIEQGVIQHLSRLDVEFRPHLITGDYYEDKHVDTIFQYYKEHLPSGNWSIPVGGLKMLSQIDQLSNGQYLLLVLDKGFCDLEALKVSSSARIAYHGSLSLMVNLHAMQVFMESQGDDVVCVSPYPVLSSCVSFRGHGLSKLPKTKAALSAYIEHNGPSCYYAQMTHVLENQTTIKDFILANLLEYSAWDADIFLGCIAQIVELIAGKNVLLKRTIEKGMPKLLGNILPIPGGEDYYLAIGLYYHAAGQFEKALSYFELSKQHAGENDFRSRVIAQCKQSLGEGSHDQVDPQLKQDKKAIDYFDVLYQAIQRHGSHLLTWCLGAAIVVGVLAMLIHWL